MGRLINHLDPVRFWGKSRTVRAGQMGSEHKGGVSFTYGAPNPWQGRESQAMPPRVSFCVAKPAAPVSDSDQRDAHVSWIVPPTNIHDVTQRTDCATTADCNRAVVNCATAAVAHHCDDYWAEAPWCDKDDYASTCAPDSDDEQDLDDDDVWDPGGDGIFSSPSYYGC